MSKEPKNFSFSTDSSKDSVHDLEMQHEALTNRLNILDDKCAIEGPNDGSFKVISSIASMSNDYTQLEKLGKGLIRASEILPKLREIEEKLSVIKIITNNEDWFISTFADVTSEVDALLAGIPQISDKDTPNNKISEIGDNEF